MSNPKGCNYTGCEFKIGDKVVVVNAQPVYEGTYANGEIVEYGKIGN